MPPKRKTKKEEKVGMYSFLRLTLFLMTGARIFVPWMLLPNIQKNPDEMCKSRSIIYNSKIMPSGTKLVNLYPTNVA